MKTQARDEAQRAACDALRRRRLLAELSAWKRVHHQVCQSLRHADPSPRHPEAIIRENMLCRRAKSIRQRFRMLALMSGPPATGSASGSCGSRLAWAPPSLGTGGGPCWMAGGGARTTRSLRGGPVHGRDESGAAASGRFRGVGRCAAGLSQRRIATFPAAVQ